MNKYLKIRETTMNPSRDEYQVHGHHGSIKRINHVSEQSKWWAFVSKLWALGGDDIALSCGRNMQWWKQIIVIAGESDSYYHYNFNTVLPSNVDSEFASTEGAFTLIISTTPTYYSLHVMLTFFFSNLFKEFY